MAEKLTPNREEKPGSANEIRNTGNLIVITGPSGVGKGTLLEILLNSVPGLARSVSTTTRDKRANEKEGIDYFFRSTTQFEAMVQAEEFMEWAEFAGKFYGTPKIWVEQTLDKGLDVLLEIEVQGARQIKARFPQAILVFLSPPSFETLTERLKTRATESPENIALRLIKAKQELEEKDLFDYEVINDYIDEAVKKLTAIVYSERCRIRKPGGEKS